jgi:tRNA(adenine34) deaminase
MTDQDFMRAALDLAREAQQKGEVPVGAVVVRAGKIIAGASNRNITDRDPSAHAEILALREAGQVAGNHRLTGCSLFVTIEPCAMCAGALLYARLERLVYGTSDPKAGAVQSAMQVLNHPALNHRMKVTAGVLEEECSAVLQGFFRDRRVAKEAK